MAAAQTVRDRYLGRNGGLVAELMQRLASAPPDSRRELGRVVNEVKQAIESRWKAYQAAAEQQAPPADAVEAIGRVRGVPARRLGHSEA